MAPSLSFFVSIPLMIVVGKKTCTSSSLVAKKWQHKCSLAVFLNLCPSPNYIKVVNCLLIFQWKIESIVSKIKSIKGVVKTEAYQPIRIKWYEEWLKKKIRYKIPLI